ncbi:MAG: hypothetical protein Q9221_002831 [Calogaya cf. arnoldii]
MSETPLSIASKPPSWKAPKSHAILPARRTLPSDIVNPQFKDLVDLALLRVFDAASFLDNRPSRLFPTVETVFGGYFTHDDWLVHGDLETELGRMNYMLSNLPERGIPTGCLTLVCFVLSSPTVLSAWEQKLPLLENKIVSEIRWVVHVMQKQQRTSISSCPKSSHITIPVDYRTDAAASNYATQLWETSLSEIAAQISKGHFEHARAFLQFFAFLKDPLCGLESVVDKAVDLFIHMMTALANSTHNYPGNPLPQAKWHAATAQAAQEALFLATPILEQINYIHFSGHQQLPYVYVALDQLPRSEFSIPEHVLRIVEEMLTSDPLENEGSCPIAPISISSYPALLPSQKGKSTTVIIDGNHRATAIMLLRFIAEYPVILTSSKHNQNDNDAHNNPLSLLHTFCKTHHLSPIWEIDLAHVLQTLLRPGSNHYASLLHRQKNLVIRFRHVHTIPALVVREDHFHTVCQQRRGVKGRPRLLLPIHQAVYNDEKLGFALPQAGQVHGRAVGYRAMPVLMEREREMD